jgi:hypothetical protein
MHIAAPEADNKIQQRQNSKLTAQDPVLGEVKGGSQVLNVAESELNGLLKLAQTCLQAAIKRQETAETALERTRSRVKQVKEENFQYLDIGAAGRRIKEQAACDMIMKEQQQAKDWAMARKSMFDKLVQRLAATATECSQLLKSAVEAETQAAERNEHAQHLLPERENIYSAALLELDASRPLEQRLRAMVYKSEQNIAELTKSCELMQARLHNLNNAWKEIKNALSPEEGLLGLRETEHMQRLLAANVSRLLPDDLRTILTERGLGMHWDAMVSQGLLPEKISNVLTNSSADGLGDLLTSLGISDLCACKRVVHVVQMAHFGLDPQAFSEGGSAKGQDSEPACCT